MDDEKLYGKEKTSLVLTCRIFSISVGKAFVIEKCAELVIKWSRTVKSIGRDPPDERLQALRGR